MNLSDQQYEDMWKSVDWKQAQATLAGYQADLTKAAFAHATNIIRQLQQKIVNDMDVRCLAVRHVSKLDSAVGVDGVKWRTDAERMRAAMALATKNYHAQNLRLIKIKDKNGKERHPCIPTYFDKAMSVLHSYALAPVVEAWSERKSFAFRAGRSTFDAHEYIMDSLREVNAPEFVIKADIKAYYAHIHHKWLLENVPMDKYVLGQFLNAGHVFAGELFPSDGYGISEGASLSPILANFVLDGLQKFIFERLGTYDSSRPDYANGNLVRFADDVLINVRTRADGMKILQWLSEFLAERGLALSDEKTQFCSVKEGFTFLSRTYVKDGIIPCSYPSQKAVDRFIADLAETVQTNKRSQRQLIQILNKKLTGWGNYFRVTNAQKAFRDIDTALHALLLKSVTEKHPKTPSKKLVEKYWYEDFNGKRYYSLPDDKTVRVMLLSDVRLIMHRKIATNRNPYLDVDYMEERTHEREIQNVTGQYRGIWERQNSGKCHYCGRHILIDQPKAIVAIDITKRPTAENCAYIHKHCEKNEFETVQDMEEDTRSWDKYNRHDIHGILEELDKVDEAGRNSEAEEQLFWTHWKYRNLRMFFAQQTKSTIILSIKEIEDILGFELGVCARKYRWFWYTTRKRRRTIIADAWTTEGYTLSKIDIEKEKLTFNRESTIEGKIPFHIPDALRQSKLPENAVYELEQFMEHIVKKYRL